MRLITHNMLICNRSKCSGGYPLKIIIKDEESSFQIDSQPVQREFIKKILPRLDYNVLYEAATSLNIDIPREYADQDLENYNFISAVHDALLNYHILEGRLVCPLCSWEYIINKGIPNMIHSELND